MQNPFADYFDRVSGFSRNAKLYIVHFMLMAFRIGAWEVAFNLYLLDQGYSTAFVGARIFFQWGTIGLLALFAGRLTDRIGRRGVVSFLGMPWELVQAYSWFSLSICLSSSP